MKFANFPILIPAFTAQIQIDTPLPITNDLLNIPFLSNSGTLISEPSYRYSLHATFVHGSDYLRRDADGQNVRLDVVSTARDDTGALLKFSYNGIVAMTGDEGKVIRGDSNATTTGFGSAFVQIRFETDSPGLKPLEDKMYVGSGRFIVQDNQPIIVEYKISEVGAVCGDQLKGAK
ncbi:Fc.00g065660.m01.CDS01 [Cosmosporella sp. VM-42]